MNKCVMKKLGRATHKEYIASKIKNDAEINGNEQNYKYKTWYYVLYFTILNSRNTVIFDIISLLPI